MAKKGRFLYTSEESESLGWDADIIDEWPSGEEFDRVLVEGHRPQMVMWHKFLRDPKGAEERKMLARLIDRLVETCPGDK